MTRSFRSVSLPWTRWSTWREREKGKMSGTVFPITLLQKEKTLGGQLEQPYSSHFHLVSTWYEWPQIKKTGRGTQRTRVFHVGKCGIFNSSQFLRETIWAVPGFPGNRVLQMRPICFWMIKFRLFLSISSSHNSMVSSTRLKNKYMWYCPINERMEVGGKVWKNSQQFFETLLDILVPLRKTETLALVLCIKN